MQWTGGRLLPYLSGGAPVYISQGHCGRLVAGMQAGVPRVQHVVTQHKQVLADAENVAHCLYDRGGGGVFVGGRNQYVVTKSA